MGIDSESDELYEDIACIKDVVHPDLIRFLLRDKILAGLEIASKNKKDKKNASVSAHVRDIKALTTIPVSSIDLSGSCTKIVLSGGKDGEKDFSRITMVKGLMAYKMIANDEKNPGSQVVTYVAVDGVSNVAYIFQRQIKKVAGQNKEADDSL